MLLRLAGESGFSRPLGLHILSDGRVCVWPSLPFLPHPSFLQQKLKAQPSQAWTKFSSATGQSLEKELALSLLLLSRPGLISATAVLTGQASTLLPTFLSR